MESCHTILFGTRIKSFVKQQKLLIWAIPQSISQPRALTLFQTNNFMINMTQGVRLTGFCIILK